MADLVVGYDGSDCANAALDAALGLAAPLGDRVVIVFGAHPGGYAGGEMPAYLDAVEEVAERATAQGVQRAAERGVEVDVEIVDSRPAQALAESASRRGARLIVVGTHSEPRLKATLLGSTPYKLLSISEIPVMVVPA